MFPDKTIAIARRLLHPVLLLFTFLLTAEVSARVEGMVVSGERFLSAPDLDADLKTHDAYGTRGKPDGRYQNCRLNSDGFRGPEIAPAPASGTTRIMVLGSSEAFGPTESEGHDFPARLGQILDTRGSYEVINASIIGMTPGSMVPYWIHWASRFESRVVIVYPNALFYLSEGDARSPAPARPISAPAVENATTQRPLGVHLESRLLVRFHRAFHWPDWIQQWRDRRAIATIVADHPAGWVFTGVPQDKIQHFRRDLETLVTSIRSDGATPLLLTHPIRALSDDRPGDRMDLFHMRTICPRGTDALFVQFTDAANRTIVDLGQQDHVQVIDMVPTLNGRRDLFIDLIHFSDTGAEQAARLLADRLAPAAGAASPR